VQLTPHHPQRFFDVSLDTSGVCSSDRRRCGPSGDPSRIEFLTSKSSKSKVASASKLQVRNKRIKDHLKEGIQQHAGAKTRAPRITNAIEWSARGKVFKAEKDDCSKAVTNYFAIKLKGKNGYAILGGRFPDRI